MILSNTKIAVITATPRTELNKAEIKIEPALGVHNLDVIARNIFIFSFIR